VGVGPIGIDLMWGGVVRKLMGILLWGSVWGKALGTHAHPNFGVIEIPIGTLAGEQILKAKGIGAKEFYMLAAIAGGAGTKGEHLTALGDHHGCVIASGTAG